MTWARTRRGNTKRFMMMTTDNGPGDAPPDEARTQFERAAEPTRNAPERKTLLERAASLRRPAQ